MKTKSFSYTRLCLNLVLLSLAATFAVAARVTCALASNEAAPPR